MQETFRWEYKEKSGNIVGFVARFDNNLSKNIIPHFKPLGQGKFARGIPEEVNGSRPLYRNYPYIEDKTVYILEGEKAVQALYSAFNLNAVTSLGGSKSAKKANWSEIKGLEHYVLIPDNDKAGLDYMKEVHQILKEQNPNATFTLLNLPNLEEKGDICDLFKQNPNFKDWDELQPVNNVVESSILNGLKTEFLRFVNQSKGNIPNEWNIKTGAKGLKSITMGDLLKMNIPPQKKLLKPWLTEQSLTMIYAGRGVGKTYFSLNCAYSLASGRDFLKYKALEPISVVYLDGEMQAPLMIERLKSIAGSDSTNVPIHLITPDLQEDRGVPDLSSIEGQTEIDEMIEKANAKVIFVDNLSTLCRSGRENEGESWLPVQNWLIKHRAKGRSVVIVHHANKEGGSRGSSRKEDILDNVIVLKRPDDYDEGNDGAKFEVHFTKSRSLFGEDIKPIIASLESHSGRWSWSNIASKQEQACELFNQGMSQTDIAKVLEVNRSTVSRWVNVAKGAK